jgi:hypothetical protein
MRICCVPDHWRRSHPAATLPRDRRPAPPVGFVRAGRGLERRRVPTRPGPAETRGECSVGRSTSGVMAALNLAGDDGGAAQRRHRSYTKDH